MNRPFLTLALTFNCLAGMAQELSRRQVDSLLNGRVLQILRSEDSLLLYESGCEGCFITGEEACSCFRTSYIIWPDGDKCFVQQIDCCGKGEPQDFDCSIWQGFEAKTGEILGSAFKSEAVTSHYDYDRISLKTPSAVRSVEMPDYYFNWGADSTMNKKVPAKLFLDKLVEAISDLEKKR